MPRRSKAARDTPFLSIVPPKPLPCPPHVKGAARQVWKEVLSSVPPDFFKPPAQALLVSYCEHVVVQRAAHSAAKRAKLGTEQHDRLTRLARAESKAIVMLARQLRLSPRSTMNSRATRDRLKEVPTVEAPWDFAG
jgi:phage terminase small subunit